MTFQETIKSILTKEDEAAIKRLIGTRIKKGSSK